MNNPETLLLRSFPGQNDVSFETASFEKASFAIGLVRNGGRVPGSAV
jgi:hypothetical protein